jgi:hypothetical protein
LRERTTNSSRTFGIPSNRSRNVRYRLLEQEDRMSFSNQACLRAALVLTISSSVLAGSATAQSALGYSPVVDFNADGYADIAEHHTASGVYYVRLNNGNGTFQPQGTWWITGSTAAPSPTWQVLTADFDNSPYAWRYADYYDIHTPSGQGWSHWGSASGFNPTGGQSGYSLPTGPFLEYLAAPGANRTALIFVHDRLTGTLFARGHLLQPIGQSNHTTQTGSDWRIAFCDMDGNGLSDLIDIYIPTAQFWVHPATDPSGINFTALHTFSATAFSSPSFTTVFGDYNADNLCDYADVNRATGQFWVHLNNGNGTFNPNNYATGFYTPNAGFSIMGLPVSIP